MHLLSRGQAFSAVDGAERAFADDMQESVLAWHASVPAAAPSKAVRCQASLEMWPWPKAMGTCNRQSGSTSARRGSDRVTKAFRATQTGVGSRDTQRERVGASRSLWEEGGEGDVSC